jgi:hypothetical protein
MKSMGLHVLFVILVGFPQLLSGAPVTVHPVENNKAMPNPLKGVRGGMSNWDVTAKYSRIEKTYIPWNAIEHNKDDGVDIIRGYTDKRWRQNGAFNIPEYYGTAKTIEELNVKVIPRIYLIWPSDEPGGNDLTYWPYDMTVGDYTSTQFQERVRNLVRKLGEAWDTDPRVGYIEMGIIGLWGEQHSPEPTLEIQNMLGELFIQHFPNKHVMVRYVYQFTDFEHFGYYWDSFAHQSTWEIENFLLPYLGLNDRWRTKPLGGEFAYFGSDEWKAGTPGGDFIETFNTPEYLEIALDVIRQTNANHLGGYFKSDNILLDENEGFHAVHKALGYRYIIEEFSYPSRVNSGEEFTVSFTVRNTGSSPMYYNWPVELSLLDTETHQPVWKGIFENVNIMDWMPSNDWDIENNKYRTPAESIHVAGTFTLPAYLEDGEHYIAIAVLDPAGNVPCLRFAVMNYFRGGRHPMGRIGINVVPTNVEMAPAEFTDPLDDRSLYYTTDFSVGIDNINIPAKTFSLQQNYPNPFNLSTTIRYQVPEDAQVVIKIYNILGQEIATLVDEQLPAGVYQAEWDGRNAAGMPIASGVYVYRMEANKFINVHKMLLMK